MAAANVQFVQPPPGGVVTTVEIVATPGSIALEDVEQLLFDERVQLVGLQLRTEQDQAVIRMQVVEFDGGPLTKRQRESLGEALEQRFAERVTRVSVTELE